MNKVIFSGRLCKDPEARTISNGNLVCSFVLAVDRDGKKDANGNKETDFLECSCFSQQATFLSTYAHKGDKILVEGKARTDRYTDQNGNNTVKTRFTIERVETLERANREGKVETQPMQKAQGGYQQPQFAPQNEPVFDVDDADLPF